MHPFRRSRGRFVASFAAEEAALLIDLLAQLAQLLGQRENESGSAEPDELVALTGIRPGPAAPPADPALARLLPDFVTGDGELSAGLRQLREPGIVAVKLQAVGIMVDDIPTSGGRVSLTDAAANQWLTTLNDLRLVLGVRIDVTEDSDPPASVQADPQGPAAAAFGIYQWLSYIQDSLVTALLGEL